MDMIVEDMAMVTRGKEAALNLVSSLCESLNAADVSYCHWKSNVALDRSASGDNDLDLLISRTGARRFTEILHRLGFKEARAPIEQQLPGVLDYYGYDVEADKIVHVHAHYQLVLGHDRSKNYRLPIEDAFLASATQDDLFKVPAVEFEFIVFVIRMILKYSTWDAILTRQGALPTAALQELAHLESSVDRTRMYTTLEQHLRYIDAKLFDACAQSLGSDYSIWTRMGNGRRLQMSLRACARKPPAADVFLKVWRRVIRGTRRRVLGRLPAKRLANGGAMIAVVGGDGAGKSTAIEGLHSWLSKDFDTTKVHIGKPLWSFTTVMVRGTLKVGRLLGELLKRESTVGAESTRNPFVFSGYSQLIRYVCVARDRYRVYLKIRRFTNNGGMVICDRFPLPQIKLMDGPQLEQLVDTVESSLLIRFLARLENKYYSRIVEPDLLILLQVDPEIAVRRKTDEDAASVRRRTTEVWRADWQGSRAHVIDASKSSAEVLSELRSLVWSQI